jgi:hypothetical protein
MSEITQPSRFIGASLTEKGRSIVERMNATGETSRQAARALGYDVQTKQEHLAMCDAVADRMIAEGHATVADKERWHAAEEAGWQD